MHYFFNSLFILICCYSTWLNAAEHSKGFDIVSLGCELSEIKQPTATTLSIKALTNKNTYRMGDSLQLEITPNQDAYITVIDQGSDEKAERDHTLFSDQFVTAEQTFTFPPPNMGKLQVSEPLGVNTFEIIASVSPYQLDDKANGKNVDLVATTNSKNLEEISRCIIRFEVIKK